MDNKTVKKPFYKKTWFIVLVVLFVIGGIAQALKSPEEKAKEAAEKQQKQEAYEAEKKEKEAKKAEKKEKSDIKDSVEKLLTDAQKDGEGYSIDIMELNEGGYAINVQIPYEVETEESEVLLSDLLNKIKDLKLENVKEITIYALYDMQFVNVVTYPDNKELKNQILADAEKHKADREVKRHTEWINNQFDAWSGDHIVLTRLIKENLNDEKSFEHIKTTFIDVFDETVKNEMNSIFQESGFNATAEIGDLVVTTEFSAKNAFNATIKSTAIGLVKANDDTVHLLSIE